MTDVLVLNAAYQPVSVVTWQKAIIKLYAVKAKDRVEIVSSYPDRQIRSASAEMPMPSVVRHIKFTRHAAKGIKFSRDNVWARDRGRCQYCGLQVSRSSYTYDHVLPKSKGGKTNWVNIVTACSRCNGRKGGRTPQEAKMKLVSVPVQPAFLPAEFKPGMRWLPGMPEEWKVWFGQDYWHGG
ncbi:HNH endonuclease [Myxococcus phage Mx1]|nr:HNH endonuclease [Myxococcus phage Mx1]